MVDRTDPIDRIMLSWTPTSSLE